MSAIHPERQYAVRRMNSRWRPLADLHALASRIPAATQKQPKPGTGDSPGQAICLIANLRSQTNRSAAVKTWPLPLQPELHYAGR